MPNRRRLALRREILIDLTGAEAARVAGAASGLPCLSLPECETRTTCNTLVTDCWSWFCTNGPCASDFQQCTTG